MAIFSPHIDSDTKHTILAFNSVCLFCKSDSCKDFVEKFIYEVNAYNSSFELKDVLIVWFFLTTKSSEAISNENPSAPLNDLDDEIPF